MSAKWKVNVTPEQSASICRMILEGHSTNHLAVVHGKSNAWIWNVATAGGLVFDKAVRKWVRTEQETTVSNEGEWNMTTEDYEALLTPEREHKTDNGAEAADAEAQPATVAISDPDLRAAYELLQQAEQRRNEDIATIDRLTHLGSRADESIVKLHKQIDDLRIETSTLRNQVLRLESENDRLEKALKLEISKSARQQDQLDRGLLRQSMDNLRKVL